MYSKILERGQCSQTENSMTSFFLISFHLLVIKVSTAKLDDSCTLTVTKMGKNSSLAV